MRLAIGSDHAGFPLKERLKSHLEGAGHEVQDGGTCSAETRVDFPDWAFKVSELVVSGKAE